jgi:tetratricopeptide (TPR) repeat protein
MKHSIAVHRITAACALALLLLSLGSSLAQPMAEPAAGITNKPEAEGQTELLQAYVHLQEQLHKAQLAIEESRIESKEYRALAEAQAAAITNTLTALKDELNAQRVQLQNDLQKSNRTLLWVATSFGGAGILALLFAALFQWRSVARVAELSVLRPQLTAGTPNALLPAAADGAAGKVVELSNQRLMAVIERLERRVFELEHSTPSPATTGIPSESGTEHADPQGQYARITLLLGKGQALLNEDQPEMALNCYNEILELDANHPEALVKKGATLERLKQDEEALRCYDRAIEADKSLTIAYLYKGGIYNRLERYNEALECYEQALRVQGHSG